MTHIHTCVVSYNRPELTKVTLQSYLDTVSTSWSLVVVDNGSDEQTTEWLRSHAEFHGHDVLLLGENKYPGYACNRGWERMPSQTTHLHRSDNDFRFLPGWCEEVLKRFRRPGIGQVGLRTKDEELGVRSNVGGNNIILRELWDKGLRYDERPWGEQYPVGYTEDSFFTPAVVAMGYNWTRVRTPCIETLASGDWSDPYYQRSYGVRGIVPGPNDPTATGIY